MKGWTVHKELCRCNDAGESKVSHKEPNGSSKCYEAWRCVEEVSLARPTLLLTCDALTSFVKYLLPDIVSAMYSGLELLTAQPIHTTHRLLIKGTFNKTDTDPSTTFIIDEVRVIPWEIQGSQYTYAGMLSAEKRKKPVDPTVLLFAVVEVKDRTSRQSVFQPHYCENIRDKGKAEREIQYGAYVGGTTDWKDTLIRKAKISNVRNKKGMEPEMTEREFSRWSEGVSGFILSMNLR